MPDAFWMTLTTLPSLAEARKMARLVLQERLAACINILGPAESHYWWKKKVEKTEEYLLLIKTHSSRFARLRRFLEKKHPYEVPEIVALPIRRGHAPYLKWLKDSLR